MSSDYEILQEKFGRFKVFIKEISRKGDQLHKFGLLSDDQWLVLVDRNILPHFKAHTVVNRRELLTRIGSTRTPTGTV